MSAELGTMRSSGSWREDAFGEQKLNRSCLEMCWRLRRGLTRYKRYGDVEGWAQRLDGLAFSTAAARVKSTQVVPVERFLEAWG